MAVDRRQENNESISLPCGSISLVFSIASHINLCVASLRLPHILETPAQLQVHGHVGNVVRGRTRPQWTRPVQDNMLQVQRELCATPHGGLMAFRGLDLIITMTTTSPEPIPRNPIDKPHIQVSTLWQGTLERAGHLLSEEARIRSPFRRRSRPPFHFHAANSDRQPRCKTTRQTDK